MSTEIEELKKRVDALECKMDGLCPECKSYIRGWKVDRDPETRHFQKHEEGYDPYSGHKIDCNNKSLKL